MDINLSDDAKAVDDALYAANAREYDPIWDVIERVAADVEEAKHAPYTSYVSTHGLYGVKVPGTDYTVYWEPRGDPTDEVHVMVIARDRPV